LLEIEWVGLAEGDRFSGTWADSRSSCTFMTARQSFTLARAAWDVALDNNTFYTTNSYYDNTILAKKAGYSLQ